MIIIDYREQQSSVHTLLEKLEVPYHFSTLDVGDYLIGDILVERKEVNDYVQSLTSGHLARQLYEMSTNYELSYLVVEGFISEVLQNRNISRSAYISSLVGSSLKRSSVGKSGVIVTVSVETDFDTALFLCYLYKKVSSKDFVRLPKIEKKSIGDKDMLEYILSSFPRIGSVYAKRLLEKFGTLRGVITADVSELKKILGDKRSLDFFLWTNMKYSQPDEKQGEVVNV